MYLSAVCFYPVLVVTVVLIHTNNGISVPAGLRPAKKFGDPKQQIVPTKQQQQQHQQQQEEQQQQQEERQQQQQQEQQHDEELNVRPTPKVPPNLSIKSRMIAALSASSSEAGKEDNSSTAPIIFSKGNKKSIPGKTASSGSSKGNIRVIIAPPATLGKDNYGLNTVLQTNLVDSRGRVMKNVSSVPIKIPSSAEMKNTRTRHTARQVESDADKVVPIKFGSTSRRR